MLVPTQKIDDSKFSSATSSVADDLMRYNWDFPDANGASDIHSLHPYPAKFIPEIPRALISVLGVPRGTAVFDPFCGCGTTLVEAQSLGHPSLGVDLNPIACLISRVKTVPLPFEFASAAETVASRARDMSKTNVPRIPNLDHWFRPSVQRALAALSAEVASDEFGDSTRDCLRLALSSIIVRVSNQESDTRYASVEKSVTAETVFSAFADSCRRINAKKSELPFALLESKVIESDILV